MQQTDNIQKKDKTQYQAELLENRLTKRYKHLRKWAKRTGVLCFRLYDRDIPEIPLAIDVYEEESETATEKNETAAEIAIKTDTVSKTTDSENTRKVLMFARIALYERPYEKQEDEERAWLSAMESSVAKVLGIPNEAIITKVRRRQSGDNQYEKDNGKPLIFITKEQGLRFKVNLSDYIDTGLFFDHRPLRLAVQGEAAGKRVLNLYCYTGAFSVYAAAGDAEQIDSVDLSSRYLGWAEENMRINGFTDKSKYRFIESDVKTFLEKMSPAAEERKYSGNRAALNSTKKEWKSGGISSNVLKSDRGRVKTALNKYDIIILDPPTFSNSKKTDTMLDINRDWPSLVKSCTELLSEGGVLYFSTNSRKLVFDEEKIPEGFSAKDITSSTIPEDFRNERIHRVWKIQKITPHYELVHGYFPEHP